MRGGGRGEAVAGARGGVGTCPSRETSCIGQRPQVEASCKYVREKRHCVSTWKGCRGMVEIKLCFQVA